MDYRQAIKSTIAYASFFSFPLFPHEIHYWLICDRPVPMGKIQKLLPQKVSLSVQKKRQALLKSSLAKVELTYRLVKFLKYIPGLRLVALTGSVAARNAKPKDDIDLLIVTAPHTLWIVRPFVLGLTSLFFRRRRPLEDPANTANAFCPNLWLDTLSLSVPRSKRNLYTAHEVLQTEPIFDKNQTYQLFLHQNNWTKKYLANAYLSSLREAKRRGNPRHGESQFFLLLAPFNLIFFFFQLLYMSSKKTTEVVGLHAAFLHTTNFSDQLNNFLDQS